MKLFRMFTLAAAVLLASVAGAEQVHQKAAGEKAAGDKKLIEIKEIKGAESGKLARVKGEMNQWGYVSYWMGIPAPAGKSVIRLRIYVDKEPTAAFGVYTHSAEGQELVRKLELPADAKPDTFITVDIPVDAKTEWGGVTLKKFEKSDKPGPWIDQVSVVLP